MKKLIHFLIVTFLISCIGLWGEIVELSLDSTIITVTEVCEANEEERKQEIKSYFNTFEAMSYNGHGGNDFDDNDLVSSIESVEPPFSQILTVFQNYCSNSLSVKSHNDQLLQTLFLPKFYILYRCSKTFLS